MTLRGIAGSRGTRLPSRRPGPGPFSCFRFSIKTTPQLRFIYRHSPAELDASFGERAAACKGARGAVAPPRTSSTSSHSGWSDTSSCLCGGEPACHHGAAGNARASVGKRAPVQQRHTRARSTHTARAHTAHTAHTHQHAASSQSHSFCVEHTLVWWEWRPSSPLTSWWRRRATADRPSRGSG